MATCLVKMGERSVSSGPDPAGGPAWSCYGSACEHRSDFLEGFYEDIVCPVCGEVAGQLKLVNRGHCCRRVACVIRVTDLATRRWGTRPPYKHTFLRPLRHVFDRRWAIDLLEYFRTCCGQFWRWPSYLDGWGRCGLCDWWEWNMFIPGGAAPLRFPICGWCYVGGRALQSAFQASTLVERTLDLRRLHLVDRTAITLLVECTADTLDLRCLLRRMPFQARWAIVEYIVS